MAIITPRFPELDAEESIEYLEAVGEWHTVRNVPRDIMIKWANYLRDKDLQENKCGSKGIQDCVGSPYDA
jgi:hypothetical protein